MRDRDRPKADLRALLERVEAASPTDAIDVVATSSPPWSGRARSAS
jgi:hypothetical protein